MQKVLVEKQRFLAELQVVGSGLHGKLGERKQSTHVGEIRAGKGKWCVALFVRFLVGGNHVFIYFLGRERS